MGGNKGGFSLVVRLCVKLKLKQVSIRHSQNAGAWGVALLLLFHGTGLPLNINNERTRVSLALETFPDFIHTVSTFHFLLPLLGSQYFEIFNALHTVLSHPKYKSLFFLHKLLVALFTFQINLLIACWILLK